MLKAVTSKWLWWEMLRKLEPVGGRGILKCLPCRLDPVPSLFQPFCFWLPWVLLCSAPDICCLTEAYLKQGSLQTRTQVCDTKIKLVSPNGLPQAFCQSNGKLTNTCPKKKNYVNQTFREGEVTQDLCPCASC